ncbi:MAG: peptidylprolyl isomerase [Kiritimatiellia bacterium]
MEKKQIKVNGQIITEDAIQFELQRIVQFYSQNGVPEEQLKSQLPQLVDQAREQAVGTKLLMDQASKMNTEVSDEEIEEQLNKVIEQVGGADAFQKALEQQQINEEIFRAQLKQGCRVDKLIQDAVKTVCDPTEDELKKYYEEHKDDFRKGERVLAQHILVSPDGSEETSKTTARQKISDIRERVSDGADFSDEAAAHSMCPSGKEGGSLGWFGRGMMVPEFDQTVFNMNVGDVSDIVETQFGYHLIYKTDHEAAAEATYEDARPKILELLRHSRRGKAVTDYVESLKAEAEVEYV